MVKNDNNNRMNYFSISLLLLYNAREIGKNNNYDLGKLI